MSKWLAKAKAILWSALVVAVMLRVILWAIQPFIPYIVIGLLIITIMGIALYRSTKL